MGLENSHFIGFLYEDNRKILGLTDELDYPFLPLLINFNVFSLNLINSIKNGFLSYGFMLDSDDKNILEYLSNPGFSARIEQINVSINDQFRFFSTSIIDYINYKKLEDKEYISFIPCNINHFWTINETDLNKQFYQISFQNNDKRAIILKVKYLKELIQKEKIEHFEHLYRIITDGNRNLIEANNIFSFNLCNLKEYLDYHLKIFYNPEIFMFLNGLTKFFSKIGETFISKEAEILNSYIGYNSVIKGKVEDSLIFNDVIILQDVHIQNSIILPGNVIAKGVKIKNTIIGLNKNVMKDITIGPNTKIGNPSQSNLKNVVYEGRLPEGYTLLGNNVLIPGGVNIGKNCVIKGKINITELKKMKTLIDGGTFESDYNS